MHVPPFLRRPAPLLGAVLLAALPAVVAVVLTGALFGTHPGRFVPYQHDEFNYWRQIATFQAVTWDGGYYTAEERPAAAAFTHFGAHGPLYVAFYGLIAKVVGWHPGSAPFVNMAVLAVALGLFVWIGRPDAARMGLAAGVLAVFWPLHMFVVSNMQEPVHDAVAIVLAACFARLIAQGAAAPRAVKGGTIGLVVFAALMRPTWAVLAVPLAFLVTGARRPRAVALALAGGATMGAALFALYGYLAAPYPMYITSRFQALYHAGETGQAWAALAGFIGSNAAALLSPRLTNAPEVLGAVQRVTVAALLLGSGFRLVRAARARRRGLAADGDVPFHVFHLLNLSGVEVLTLLLLPAASYHDYRPTAPHLLLTLLVYVLARRRFVPLACAAALAMLVTVFVSDYRTYHLPAFENEYAFYGAEARAMYGRAVADHVRYDPALGPWDNTLLVEVRTYNKHLLAIDPGIGVSRVFNWNRVRYPLRSRYLLLGPGTARRLAGRARLRRVSVSPFGILYVNLDNAAERRAAPP